MYPVLQTTVNAPIAPLTTNHLPSTIMVQTQDPLCPLND